MVPMRVIRTDATNSGPVWRRFGVAIAYGVVCHASFIVGVGAMIVMMFFGMSRSLGRLDTPWSVAANLALLLQFPLAHSALLGRRGAKLLARAPPRPIGQDLATTTYATVASMQVALLFLGWSPSGIIWWQAQGFALTTLCTLYLVSWLLLLKAIRDAGFAQQIGLLGWWAVYRKVPPCYAPMPQRGLFRFCRQPIYVAFAMTLWTVPTWTPDQLEVAVVLTLYCVIGPLLKERRFSRRFGEQFRAYQRRVPYWFPLYRTRTPPAKPGDV